ncbi:MAG: hypothetical protein KME26_15320 [Oscillatoria princeps RMCB-10]|nr:hypothetical protein [Oscillatoria princeps RMCB-10]
MRGVLVDVSTARRFEGVQLAPEQGTATRRGGFPQGRRMREAKWLYHIAGA